MMNYFKKLFKRKLNIQIEGTYENYYSLSLVNQSIARALKKHTNYSVKLDPTIYHKEYMQQQKDLPLDMVELTKVKMEHIDISIRNIFPPHTKDMKGDIKIFGPYGWEESKFPLEYVDWFNTKLDMVFTMSDYVKDVLLNSGVTVPVETIGLVVEDILYTDSKQLDFPLPDGFRLLHISSCFPRKGADLLLKVFDSIDDLDISLIIKTFPNPHNNITEQLNALGFKLEKEYEEDLHLYSKNSKQILLINKNIPQSQIKYLYENTNLLVAPSYGEGFGLPMAEAMLCDLPVLTTGYGGQSDFCTNETSWLIDYEFKPALTHMNLKDSLWAVPKESSLKDSIENIYHLYNGTILKQKIIKAKQYIITNYSAKKIALNIQRQIDDI